MTDALAAAVDGPGDEDAPAEGVVRKGRFDPVDYLGHPVARTINSAVDALDPVEDPAAEHRLGETTLATLEYYYGAEIPPWCVLVMVTGTVGSKVAMHRFANAKPPADKARAASAPDFRGV